MGTDCWITTFKTNRIRNKGRFKMETRQHWKHVYEGNEASTTNILANCVISM